MPPNITNTAEPSSVTSPLTKKLKQVVGLNSALATSTKNNPPKPVEKFRLKYTPLKYKVTHVSLDFNINERNTVVKTVMTVEKNGDSAANADDNIMDTPTAGEVVDGLDLDGDERVVTLLELSVDGCTDALIPDVDYTLKPGKLIIHAKTLHRGASAASTNNNTMIVRTTVMIVPEDNTQLSGLYNDGTMYCTQCEAEGFRRITYYPDRPDNMATFTSVRIEANSTLFPVLLSNGNLIETGICGNDDDENGGLRKFVVWHDPFPKPSYLFALVAGDLGMIDGRYTTMSGREVMLRFYSEHKNTNKLNYALESLQRAMKWDEDTYGLEYDLDLFNVVAVESFNMGAMENKSLNVFNTSCVLADPVTSTDAEYFRVEGIIGHEYFHNWTGNRVTCRDWFQLTLKEGLTVYRDQQFSGQVNNCAAVTRIQNVQVVRGGQFMEDDGPMSHPIRPDSYIAMDNFYTSTVYRKGAEVIRMYETILGTAGFRKGMDLYFQRHDGSAVTCDDFLSAMADANDVDLSQFAKWYSTSGTPVVTYSSIYDHEKGTYQLTLSQSSRSDEPLLIPIAFGLLDKETGKEVVSTTILQLKESTQTFDFHHLKGDVIPSILRNWSAPIKVLPASGAVDEKDLAFLASWDTDGFNRWDSAQRLYEATILKVINHEDHEESLDLVLKSFSQTLTDERISDDSIRAFTLILPSESTLSKAVSPIDPPAILRARNHVKQLIARKYKEELLVAYKKLTTDIDIEGTTFKVDGVAVGRRRLRNVYLGYLCSICGTDEEQKESAILATDHFNAATGMTDKLAALGILVSMSGEGATARDAAIEKFYHDANGDSLQLNKWFAVQADAELPDVLDRVMKLTIHPEFSIKNPNRCRSLIMTFAMNAAAFHAEDGRGYTFLGDMLEQIGKQEKQF
jgi:aminopeptidase N